MAELDKPFVVVKFLPTESDDSVYLEVSLASWITSELDDDMKGKMKWPPESKPVSNIVKTQQSCQPEWKEYDVQVMRYFETYMRAREAVPKFLEDSTYETEAENTGLGKRRRRKPAALLSSDSEEEPILRKRVKTSIPPPPPIGKKKEVTRKGQGLTREEQKKKERQEVMERLKAARAVVAARTSQQSPFTASKPTSSNIIKPSSPKISKASPMKSLKSKPSPWKVSALGNTSKAVTPTKITTTDDSFSKVLENENEMEEYYDDDDIFAETPMKTPTQSSAREKNNGSPSLVRQNAFHISPHSGKSMSPSEQRYSTLGSSKDKDTQSVPISPSPLDSIPVDKSSAGFQYCRNLFSGANSSKANKTSASSNSCQSKQSRTQVDTKSIEERLHALELAIGRVVVLLNEVSSKLDISVMNVARVQRALMPNERRLAVPPNMPPLPLKCRNSLNKYETFLGETDVNLSAVCDYLASYIRTTVPDPERKSTQNILSKLLTNNLAKEMNLDGGNNKIAFRSLNLYKAFQGTLQSAFPDSDLSVAEDALQKWLKDAKWRKQQSAVTGA